MIPTPLLPQSWVPNLGWALIQFLWQGTLLAVLFAAARAALGGVLSSQARYVLACGTLSAMVAAPVLTFIAGPLLAAGAPVSSWPLASAAAWADVMPILVAAWLAGVLLFSVRLLGGWRITARLRTSGVRPAPAEWQATLNALIERLRVSRPVRLLVSSLVEVPTVIGWLRPVVLGGSRRPRCT
jgi:beta-lactamase regulating signal transducer with metallopeptidase domain